MKLFAWALVMAVVYLILGNVTAISGAHVQSNQLLNSTFIQIFFAPYTFIAGLSTLAGWDSLSFLAEVVVFAITIPFFYSVLLVGRYMLRRCFGRD